MIRINLAENRDNTADYCGHDSEALGLRKWEEGRISELAANLLGCPGLCSMALVAATDTSHSNVTITRYIEHIIQLWISFDSHNSDSTSPQTFRPATLARCIFAWVAK